MLRLMGGLTENDGARVLDGLAELYALGPLEEFPARALRVVHRVVGCDEASFNEIELASGTFRVLVDPDEKTRSAAAPQFARFIHEHPVIAHFAATGDPRPHAISEFLRPAEFHRLGLYGEFFAPLGIEDQLSVTLLDAPADRVIGVALDRDGSFSHRDHLLLDALRPHLLLAYKNAAAYSEALSRREGDAELSNRAREALARLSTRERQVLALVSSGMTNGAIAAELGIRPATAKKHVEHILARLGVETRLGAARIHLAGSPAHAAERWWILDGTAERELGVARH